MKQIIVLTKRNVKLFFTDKGMFFTSLITPGILLVLYATFLSNVYKDSFLSALPEGLALKEELINACVGGQLISSILAVSCVTVAFCSNLLMVQDKASSVIKDLTISPVKPSSLALGYYFATLISTLTICLASAALCLVYIYSIGWYMSLADVLYLLLDVFLLVMFGTALSSIIGHFLSTQGQISAVGTIISSCYGFICGAYMPISQFSEGLQKVISLLPGTYGTSLLRNHATRGAFEEMISSGFPEEAVTAMQDTIDCNVHFLGNSEAVSIPAMYTILSVSVLVLVITYILLNIFKGKKAK